jgi:hypothetical protein
MLKLKIDNKDYQLPLDWEELSLKSYSNLRKLPDTADAVTVAACLLGIDVDTLNNADLANFHLTIGVNLGWLSRLPKFDKPDVVDYNGKVLNVPDGFEGLKFRQKLEFQQLALTNTSGVEVNPDCYAKLLAIIFCVEAFGSYSASGVNKLTAWFEDYPLTAAKPLIDFFLSGLLKSSNVKPITSAASQSPKRLPQVLNVLKNMVRTRKSVQ